MQIRPGKPALDHADYSAPTRQHGLDHTDHTDHTDQECLYLLCLAALDHEMQWESVICP